jgi:PAP2 superfamily
MSGSIESTETGLAGGALSFPGRWLWLSVAAIFVIDATWLAMSQRLSLDLQSARSMVPGVTLLPLVAVYCHSRTDFRLQQLAPPLAGALFITLAFAALRVLDHLMMSLPFPWADDTLARLDADLGFDWLNYTRWAAARPLVVAAFRFSYTGLTLVTLFVFIVLFAAGERARAKEFLRFVFWSALATVILGAAVPARGAMYRFASTNLQSVFGAEAGIYPLPYLNALRSHAPHILNFQDLPGLVSMPSFHTACALLVAYSCRNIRILGTLSILYAAVMIASTPIMGGHYFVDLIGGAALMTAIVLLDKRISYSSEVSPAAYAMATTQPQCHDEISLLQSAQCGDSGGAENRPLEHLAIPTSGRP